MPNASATSTVVECLRFAAEGSRATEALKALTAAASSAGVDLRPSRAYRGDARWLLLWGPGHPSRFEPMRRQVAAGGHVLALDLSYWQRDRKFRVSIDAAHPQAWVMRRVWPADRLQADGVAIREDAWDPTGPVLIAGIGDKAKQQYGRAVGDWEQTMTAEAIRRGYRVTYRPKLRAQPSSIDKALQGMSAVLTWHSNVAVDAIRMGVPVICRDGAAAAVCPSTWPEALAPLDTALRDTFLANLAHFQWGMEGTEPEACWRWLQECLSCAS